MLRIEFLYYDKTSCQRCAATDKAVKISLKELKSAIKGSRPKISFKEKKLPLSKISLSPSILINGEDVEKIISKNSKLKSNSCKSCCELAGQPVSCRTFNYKGKSHDYMPKEMIAEAIGIALRQKK